MGRSEENINKYIQVPTSILGMRGLGEEERRRNRTEQEEIGRGMRSGMIGDEGKIDQKRRRV